MKILAIDASTKSTGYAIYDGAQLKKYGCLTASSTDVIKRIQKIVKGLDNLIKENQIEAIVMEEVIPEKEHTNKTYKALMWLQAAINFMLHDTYADIGITYYLPSEWRATCGIRTGAGIQRPELKKADMAFVKSTYKIEANDDICDAIGIGHAYNEKHHQIEGFSFSY